MNNKVKSYTELATKTSGQITGSYTEWTAFLATAARLYKYPYHEQLLIYAQRPDATACASFDVWKERMNRAVRRGSKGIAILDTTHGSPQIRYVFDVADTVGRQNARRPFLWQLQEDNTDAVVQALSDRYDISADFGLAWQLESIAATLAEEYWQENQADILASVEGSFLEELDRDNIKASFCEAASVSTLYILLTRCGLDADQTLGHEDFLSVFDFNTPAMTTALGTAVSQNSEQVLRQIEVTIKNYERSRAHDRVELSAGGGLPAARTGDNTPAPTDGQIRGDEAGLPERAQASAIQPPAIGGDVGPAPDGNRADSEPAAGIGDTAVAEVHGDNGTDKDPRPHEVGGADEQRQAESRGNDSDRTGVQLEEENGQFSLFDTGSFEPLSKERPAGGASVSQAVMDEALRIGANDPSSRLRITAEFMKGKTTQENAAFLENHYGENGAGFYVGERKYALWYNEAGLMISPGESVNERFASVVTWEQAAGRIKELLEAGEYAGQVTLYRAWPFEKQRVAEALQFLHRDIAEEYKESYLPTLTAAIGDTYIYPDVVDKTKALLDEPQKLKAVISEFEAFLKEYAHNQDLLRFRNRHTDEILQGLKDLQIEPVKFTAAEDLNPQRRLFISQDEIDNLLREHPDHNEYRIGIVKYFEIHPDKKEREKYLSHLHGEYSGYHGGNDSVTYTYKQLEFSHGRTSEPYAKVELKWNKVRKRIEELIAKDAFLSAEDKEIMEGRVQEIVQEELPDPAPSPTVRELYEKYKSMVLDAVSKDEAYHNACRNSDEENARIEGNAAVKRAVDSLGDLGLTKLYYDLEGFHRRLHQEVIEETFPQLHELDNFEDIDTAAIRESLESGEPSPFVEQVMADVERIAAQEAAVETPSVDALGSFVYNGFHFEPVGVLGEDFDANDTVRHTVPHNELGMTNYQDAKRPYTHAAFYAASGNTSADVFRCLETGKLYLPGTNELFEYTGTFQPYQELAREAAPETPSEEAASAAEELTDLQKKATEIAKKYENLSMQEKIGIIAQTFGCTSGKIETSPCYGKWRGTSDISIRFDNGASYFLGNARTPQAKTAKAQNEYVTAALRWYNPEIVQATKEAALPALIKREEKDNAIAAQKGLKPYTVLNVELNDGADDKSSGYIGWYYVTLAVDGKIFTHLETGLNHDISSGKVSESPTIERYFAAGALKDTDVDYVFNNVGFSSSSDLYSLRLRDDVRERAEKKLAEREKALDETYTALTTPQQEHEQTVDDNDLDTVPYNFELEYRLLSRLKSDCEYFLGAGNRHEKHLWAGNTSLHIKKMRELYDLLPEKPEWLTKEDIDRYAQRIAPRYEVVVYHHFVNDFDEKLDYQTLGEAEKAAQGYVDGTMDEDGFAYEGAAVYDFHEKKWLRIWGNFPDEKAIAQVEQGLSEAENVPVQQVLSDVEQPASPHQEVRIETHPQQRPGQTRPERNYRNLVKMFPEISSGEYRYLRLEAGGSMMPLHVEWVEEDVIAISHTFTQNGDLMRDPEMTFRIDREKGTMEALTFQQDGALPLYQEVYPEPGIWIPKLRKDLNRFTQQWMQNIREQGYQKERATVVRNGVDVEITFDQHGNEMESTEELQDTSHEGNLAVDPEEIDGDLRDALTGEGGMLSPQNKELISQWLRSGERNTEIAAKLMETYKGSAETLTLATGEEADYYATELFFEVDVHDRFDTQIQKSWEEVASILRSLWNRDMDGFTQEPPEKPTVTVNPQTIYPAEKNHLPFDVVIQTLHVDEPEPHPTPTAQNFRITDDNLGVGGVKDKFRSNMDAIKLVKQLSAEGRQATPEEQETLSKYVGWGGLPNAFDESKTAWANEYKELKEALTPKEYESARASVLNAHFTTPTVIKAMYKTVENMGFKGGNILEPSCGVGNFFGCLPESMAGSKLYGVELDSITGQIARQLYPQADIKIAGFQTTDRRNFYDLAIGNVPFGKYQVYDPAYNKLGFSIHNYFFGATRS